MLNRGGSVEAPEEPSEDTISSTISSNGPASTNNDNEDELNTSYPTTAEPFITYKDGMNFYGKQPNNSLSSDGYIDYTTSSTAKTVIILFFILFLFIIKLINLFIIYYFFTGI